MPSKQGNVPWQGRKIINALKAETRAHGGVCARCGGDFVWDMGPRHPMAFSAGHIRARSIGGSDVDPANYRPEHFGPCNSAYGNGVTRGLGTTDSSRRDPRWDMPDGDNHSETWP